MTGKGRSPKQDPAAGQAGPASAPLGGGIFDALEMTRQAWLNMAAPAGLAPAFDPEELERRLKDMRAVEQWLSMNLNMLRGTIQALETQHATLLALQSLGQSAPQAKAAGKAGAPALDPAALWQQLQEQFQRVALGALGSGAAKPAAPDKPAGRPKTAGK
jgi:hypothetical protein